MEVKSLSRADCWVLWRCLQIVGGGLPKEVVKKLTLQYGSYGSLIPGQKPKLSILEEAYDIYPDVLLRVESDCLEVVKVFLHRAVEQLCNEIDVMRSLLYGLYKETKYHRCLPHLSAMFYYTFKCLKGEFPRKEWLEEVGLIKISEGWWELQEICKQRYILFCRDGRVRDMFWWKQEWYYGLPQDDIVFETSERMKANVERWLQGVMTYPHLRYWGDYSKWVNAALEELMSSSMPALKIGNDCPNV